MTASWGRLTVAEHMMDSGVFTPHNLDKDYHRRSSRDQDDATYLSSDRCWKVDSARSTPSYQLQTPTTSFRRYDEPAKDSDYTARTTWTRTTPSGSKRAQGSRQSPSRLRQTSLRGTVQYPAYTHDQLVNSIRLRLEEQQELRSKLISFRVRAITDKGLDAIGSINDHPRVIPYSGKGAKQDSWTRTGRKALEGECCDCVCCQHRGRLTLERSDPVQLLARVGRSHVHSHVGLSDRPRPHTLVLCGRRRTRNEGESSTVHHTSTRTR
jgi:hypothetical protein